MYRIRPSPRASRKMHAAQPDVRRSRSPRVRWTPQRFVLFLAVVCLACGGNEGGKTGASATRVTGTSGVTMTDGAALTGGTGTGGATTSGMGTGGASGDHPGFGTLLFTR